MADIYEVCGYCGGRGQVFRSMYNRLGERIADKPPLVICEYCGGTGECVNGSNLWPAPTREQILKKQGDASTVVTDDDGDPE